MERSDPLEEEASFGSCGDSWGWEKGVSGEMLRVRARGSATRSEVASDTRVMSNSSRAPISSPSDSRMSSSWEFRSDSPMDSWLSGMTRAEERKFSSGAEEEDCSSSEAGANTSTKGSEWSNCREGVKRKALSSCSEVSCSLSFFPKPYKRTIKIS